MKIHRLLAALALLVPATALAQTLVTDFPVTNGAVNAVLFVPETNEILIGGSFSRIGPFTGSFAGVDRTTAEWVTPNFSKSNGPVFAALPDGTGGWYLGGRFSSVGGQPRRSLAHVLSDGTVDPNWVPDVLLAGDLTANASVTAMVIQGDLLYIGGDFNLTSGGNRQQLAAIDLVAGTFTAFNPGVLGADFGPLPTVTALAGDTINLYVGGYDIETVGGAARNNLASINLSTGLTTAWNPSPNGRVDDLVIDGGEVLVAGDYSSIGGAARENLAAINISTGLASAFFTPNPNGFLRSIRVSGATVYLGGFFTTAGGQVRNNLAAVNRTTGVALAWNPVPDDDVSKIAVQGSTVYASGFFSTINGGAARYIAQIDALTGARIPWDVQPSYAPSVIIPTPTTVFIGGDIQTIGGVARKNLASLNATSGAIGTFDSDINGAVYALARSGNTLFVGGDFTNAGGQARKSLAAFARDGTLLPPLADVTGIVYALSVDGSSLFAGGNFTQINGTARLDLGELLIANGALTGWNPSTDGTVRTIATDGSVAFIGGDFSNTGGQARENLAALSRSTGLATAWQADTNQAVNSLGRKNDTLYAAGRFDTISGQPRGRLAALDTGTADVLPWSPTITDGTSNTILIGESTAFVGGGWTEFNGAPSGGLREVGLISGAEPPFVDPFLGNILALAASPTRLFAGGTMSSLGDGRANLAIFDLDLPAPPDPASPPPKLKAKGKLKLTTTKSKLTLKGTATNATLVQFKIGKAGFRNAKGNTKNWKLPVKLKPGKTTVKVLATGPGGTSKTLKFTITRD